MLIPKIRRTLNDSSIGRSINNSIPGIYIEAISREISDCFRNMYYDSLPRTSFEDGIFHGQNPVMEAIFRDWKKDANPQRSYSWMTPFYRRIRIEEGKDIMERVTTDDIFKKLKV